MNRTGTILLERQEPSLDARNIEALIALWLEDAADRLDGPLTPAGLTPAERCQPSRFQGKTVRGYAQKIVYFINWWSEVGPDCNWLLTQRRLRDFERWLRKRPAKYGQSLSYHTRRDALRRLRGVFVFGEREGYIRNVQLSHWVPTPAGSAPEHELIGADLLNNLIDAARTSSQPVRDMAILATLIGTGMRREECVMLNVEDVHLDEDGSGEIVIRNPKKVRGKEGEPRVRRVAIDAVAGVYLQRWIEGCQRNAGPLWPNKHGEHVGAKTIYYIASRCWKKAGLAANQPVHDFRRIYITEWKRQHEDTKDQLLARQVGHSSTRMIMHYTKRNVDDIRKVAQSPMSNVGILISDWPLDEAPTD